MNSEGRGAHCCFPGEVKAQRAGLQDVHLAAECGLGGAQALVTPAAVLESASGLRASVVLAQDPGPSGGRHWRSGE